MTTETAGPAIEVKLGLDPHARLVGISAKHRLAIEGVEFSLSFATIKSLAAQILSIEASAEIKAQAARSPLVRS